MPRTLAESLAVVGNDDLAARVLRGLFAVMPFAPSWEPPKDLLALAARHDPARAAQIAARAEELARDAGAQSALATFDFLDKSDKGIAVFSGLRGAVKAYQGDRTAALEMDPQQAADAGLKAVGLGYVAFKLFTGPLAPHTGTGAADKLKAFTGTETGRALLLWFVAADLVLPFADNLAQGGTAAVTSFLDEQAGAHAERLSAVAGPEAGEAAGMFRQMLATVQTSLGQAATYAAPLTAYTKEQLPGILATVDKATGVVATGVDVLSTWRCLGNVLVAEVCVARAAELVAADVEEERRQAEIARVNAEREQKERARASAQQEQYTLDDAVPASSLKASPIKVTRSADVPAPAAAALPEKKGCFGCGAMFLFVVLPTLAAVPAWIGWTLWS